MKIVAVGTGYVGMACLGFSRFGHTVVGVDVNEEKIINLQQGILPISEPGLQDLFNEGVSAGLLSFTTDLKAALSGADLCFICVGTPDQADGSVDLSFVETAVGQVKAAKEEKTLIVIKSTVPVGTCRRLGAISNPEFLRESQAVKDFLHPDRIVIGVDQVGQEKIMLELYKNFDVPKLVMSTVSSELTKYAANGFLATKISFVSEVANLCDRVGANILDVTKSIGLDPRIGPHFLNAGIGYGGSCFPKDILALEKTAHEHNVSFRILRAAIDSNQAARDRFVERVLQQIKNDHPSFAVWGVAFKAGTDDVRKSAAVEIVKSLLVRGARVSIFDQLAQKNAEGIFGDQAIFVQDPLSAITVLDKPDALLVLTEEKMFKDEIFKVPTSVPIFDGRNILADLKLQEKGYAYVGVGLGQ